MKEWLAKKVKEQFLSNERVTPEFKWASHVGKFFVNSRFGLLEYKVKNEKDLIRFRHKWANKFELSFGNDKKLANLYDEVRAAEKIRYRANVKTRWELYCAAKIGIYK